MELAEGKLDHMLYNVKSSPVSLSFAWMLLVLGGFIPLSAWKLLSSTVSSHHGKSFAASIPELNSSHVCPCGLESVE